ncbi:hypothetical protein [Streptomyces sp. URMC 129]|uniref:hypothetical protein n=1 Tax=Streptomyces sp. URMC 129 TaxID=3423407 RepID=UPI003F1A32FF
MIRVEREPGASSLLVISLPGVEVVMSRTPPASSRAVVIDLLGRLDERWYWTYQAAPDWNAVGRLDEWWYALHRRALRWLGEDPGKADAMYPDRPPAHPCPHEAAAMEALTAEEMGGQDDSPH